MSATTINSVKYIDTVGFNNVMVCNNEWLYTKRKTTHVGSSDETSYWYCRTRKCPGSVTVNDGNVRHSADHKTNCSQAAITIEKLLFYDAIKKKCRENIDMPYIQIYHQMQKEYPNAILRVKFATIRRSMFYWRYPHITRLPTTMLQMDELMKIPYYYKEFGTMTIDDSDKELYAGTFQVPTVSKGKSINSTFMAFRNTPIINMIRGRILKLGGDGTFSIRPRKRKGAKQYFDNIQQIYSVHVIIHRRFYTIATFVLQNSTTEVMAKVFSLLNEWLQEGGQNTIVQSFMADYECSSRGVLQDIWPECKILGCSVHFQRAIFKFGRKLGVYSDKTKVYEKHLLAQVYGLCYLRAENMATAFGHFQEQAVGNLHDFGNKLMDYLRRQWMDKNISVADEDVRANNGSETFHYSIQRIHSWMCNNILDFMGFVRTIHTKSAVEFTQWLSIQTSKRQKKLEETHCRLQHNFQENLQILGERKAVAKFLADAVHITKRVQTFFDNVNPNIEYDEIDFTDLIIQDKRTSVQHITTNVDSTFQITIHCSGIQLPLKLSQRIVRFSAEPVVLGLANIDNAPSTRNLYFHDHTIAARHAEFKLVNKNVYLRDLGSEFGTTINGKRFGSTGHISDPVAISDGDTIKFGNLQTIISIPCLEPVPTTNERRARTTATIKITCDDLQTPEREIELSDTKATILGRSRPAAPATPQNGLFNSKHVVYKHANIWFTRNALYIQPIGPTYISNTPLTQITQIHAPTTITLGQINSSRCVTVHINVVTARVEESTDKNPGHEGQAFMCEQCVDAAFDTKLNLDRHIRRAHQTNKLSETRPVETDVSMDITFTCALCVGVEFDTQVNLDRHNRRMHQANALPTLVYTDLPTETVFPCVHCFDELKYFLSCI